MYYYEVMPTDSRYHGDKPLTYSFEQDLPILCPVIVNVREHGSVGFVVGKTTKPKFSVKPIKSVVSNKPLPQHCLALAKWMQNYYSCSLSDALKQFAPANQSVPRELKLEKIINSSGQIPINAPLTTEQKNAIKQINASKSTTQLLHGETGSGKTRVYLELTSQTIKAGKSVILLTPEISLTTQLIKAVKDLGHPYYLLHSQLTSAQRKRLWLQILNDTKPAVIVGPRSALFAPVKDLGLIVLDEAHEPAYKQDQSPRYSTARVASQLGKLTGAKVILGTATPLVTDYYLAQSKGAVVRMQNQATSGSSADIYFTVVDLKDRTNFSRDQHFSNQLIDAIGQALSDKKQAMVYLNRRGSARLVTCTNCGWQLLCPNCDLALVYHADEHTARCHTCGYKESPPSNCPVCNKPDIIYKSIGTKALTENLIRLFPQARIKRFDSDNIKGERVDELYEELIEGKVDILVGTQLLAKGLDLPKLTVVGIVVAESSLSLPDYSSSERNFQLLYQVIGRVGRGHAKGKVIIQSYDPKSNLIKSAVDRNWLEFYKDLLAERRQFRFPPFSYLMRLECQRSTEAGASKAAQDLKAKLSSKGLAVEVIGPSPSFYSRRGDAFYYQLVVKSKDRDLLLDLAADVPAGWKIDLDPTDLL